jgi:hypothetical protein
MQRSKTDMENNKPEKVINSNSVLQGGDYKCMYMLLMMMMIVMMSMG